jgi:hypothetical protein
MRRTENPWPQEVTFSERMEIVEQAIADHGATLRAGHNVMSLGAGLEHTSVAPNSTRLQVARIDRGSEDENDIFVPCIQVTVTSKWSYGAEGSEGALPNSVRVTQTIRGKEFTIDVPVDVTPHVPPRLHSWECDALRNRDVASGSAACLVQSGGNGPPMLLSFHHVLALMESQPIGSGGDVFVTYQGVGGSRQVVLPTHPAACDAAITRSPSSVWTPCDQVPTYFGAPERRYASNRDSFCANARWRTHAVVGDEARIVRSRGLRGR